MSNSTHFDDDNLEAACESPAPIGVEPAEDGRELPTDWGQDEDGEQQEGLADDPEVSRLLAELQNESTASDGSESDADVEGGEQAIGAASDGRSTHEACDACDRTDQRARNARSDNLNGRNAPDSVQRPFALGSDISDTPENRGKDRDPRNADEKRIDGVSPLILGNDNIDGEADFSRAKRHDRVDISRIKIDGTERGARAGPRPQSAPSTYWSAGGGSRLSRTSSSCLARTVSQKLLQATQDAKELSSFEAQQGERSQRFTEGSKIARANGRISAVMQDADALQVCVGEGVAGQYICCRCLLR